MVFVSGYHQTSVDDMGFLTTFSHKFVCFWYRVMVYLNGFGIEGSHVCEVLKRIF